VILQVRITILSADKIFRQFFIRRATVFNSNLIGLSSGERGGKEMGSCSFGVLLENNKQRAQIDS
jgi:hypothetical protein